MDDVCFCCLHNIISVLKIRLFSISEASHIKLYKFDYYFFLLYPRYQCSRGRFEKIRENEKAGYV